jgi:exonuclease III
MKLCSWNVQSLFIAGDMKILTNETYEVDTLAVQEVRQKGNRVTEKKTHYIFYSCDQYTYWGKWKRQESDGRQ